MPRPLNDLNQPQRAPSAGDLGREAYEANRHDPSGLDPTGRGERAGTTPIWQSPEPENAPPGQNRKKGGEVRMGREP